jgi:hypothetical protein
MSVTCAIRRRAADRDATGGFTQRLAGLRPDDLCNCAWKRTGRASAMIRSAESAPRDRVCRAGRTEGRIALAGSSGETQENRAGTSPSRAAHGNNLAAPAKSSSLPITNFTSRLPAVGQMSPSVLGASRRCWTHEVLNAPRAGVDRRMSSRRWSRASRCTAERTALRAAAAIRCSSGSPPVNSTRGIETGRERSDTGAAKRRTSGPDVLDRSATACLNAKGGVANRARDAAESRSGRTAAAKCAFALLAHADLADADARACGLGVWSRS